MSITALVIFVHFQENVYIDSDEMGFCIARNCSMDLQLPFSNHSAEHAKFAFLITFSVTSHSSRALSLLVTSTLPHEVTPWILQNCDYIIMTTAQNTNLRIIGLINYFKSSSKAMLILSYISLKTII